MLKKYELNRSDYKSLISYAKSKKIKFLSSPFDIESIFFLNKFDLDYIKIPSGEITNHFLLNAININKSKVILSTGMSNLREIVHAINVLSKIKI